MIMFAIPLKLPCFMVLKLNYIGFSNRLGLGTLNLTKSITYHSSSSLCSFRLKKMRVD